MSSHHVLPIRVYLQVFGALMGLTALTTWIAYQDLGALNTTIALLIAGVKMTLVMLYFMHLRYSSKLVWVMAVAGFFWLAILLVLTAQDYLTRVPVHSWLS